MNIKKDPITGASREIRIHAIGDKVIRGASAPRGANVLDHLYARQAEDYFQKVLNKMPKSQRKANMTWAPDIAITDKGMRIIETNRGTASSGLIDPLYLSKKNKGLKGWISGAKAISTNNAIYKHITGRHAPVPAALRAAAAGGVAATASNQYSKYRNEKEDKPATRLEAIRKPRYKADGTPAEADEG